PEHFAGDDEIEPVGLHPFARLAHHEALAVEARIEVRAVSLLGVDHDFLVVLDHVDDVQLDAELLRHPEGVVALRPGALVAPDRLGVPLDAEARVEVDAFHVHAVVLHHARGEHGVEAARDQGDALARRTGGGGAAHDAGSREWVAVGPAILIQRRGNGEKRRLARTPSSPARPNEAGPVRGPLELVPASATGSPPSRWFGRQLREQAQITISDAAGLVHARAPGPGGAPRARRRRARQARSRAVILR